MSAIERGPGGRRLTVTLDVVEPEAVELARAVRLAARLNAELEGVFVEDQDLLQLSALPFVRELRSISLASEALSAPRIERELRILARRAEQALREQAQRAGVRWSFRVWRGSVGPGLLTELGAADVLSLGRLGVLFSPRRDAGPRGVPPVAVIAGATDSGRRALETAIEWAEDLGGPLVVIAAAPTVAGESALAPDTTARLAQTSVPVSLIVRPGIDPLEVRAAVNRAEGPLLVVPGDYPYLQSIPLRQLISALGCHLLVVR